MPELSPSQRVLRARQSAYSMHAQSKTNTTAARAAFLDRCEREVDPDGVLPATERAKRAEHARKAHFTKLAYAQGAGEMSAAIEVAELDMPPEAMQAAAAGESVSLPGHDAVQAAWEAPAAFTVAGSADDVLRKLHGAGQ